GSTRDGIEAPGWTRCVFEIADAGDTKVNHPIRHPAATRTVLLNWCMTSPFVGTNLSFSLSFWPPTRRFHARAFPVSGVFIWVSGKLGQELQRPRDLMC